MRTIKIRKHSKVVSETERSKFVKAVEMLKARGLDWKVARGIVKWRLMQRKSIEVVDGTFSKNPIGWESA
jgi:hypothetical protein